MAVAASGMLAGAVYVDPGTGLVRATVGAEFGPRHAVPFTVNAVGATLLPE